MLKFLLKLSLLTAMVIGVILLVQHVGPLGPDTKIMLKYIGLGALALAALCVVSITVIALAGIALAVFAIKRGAASAEKMAGGIRGGLDGLKGLSGLAGLAGLQGLGDIGKMSGRTVEISVPKYDAASFKVKTMTGDLDVTGQDGEGARATVELLERSEGDAEACFENGELKVKSRSGAKVMLGDAKVFLPARLSSLSVESVNGDITVSGFQTDGPAFFKGVNGDIGVSGLKNTAEVAVKTISGDVEIKDSQLASLTAQTISGDVEIKDSSADRAVMKTVSGDIDYTGSAIKEPVVKTTSGCVRR